MSAPALTLDGLGVTFSGFKAVDCFSMVVNAGEVRVLLGANGAGKTTLMDLISGKTKSTAGEVRLFGRDITNLEEHHIAQAGVGRKFQIPSIFRDLSVRDNLVVACTRRSSVLSNLRVKRSAGERQRFEEVVETVGLSGSLDRLAGALSHGETQWLELGMLIGQGAKVILLDEPTAGMTQGETMKTAELINTMRGSHTMLVVEHDMAFVREIASKITVMHLGKHLAEGSIASIEANEDVRNAYLGSGGIH